MKPLTLSLLLLWLPLFSFTQSNDATAISQEVDSLIQVNRALLEEEQHEEALQAIELARAKASETLGKAHVAYAACLFNQGRTLQRMGKTEESEAFYLEAKGIYEENVPLQEPSFYLNCLDNLGYLYKSINQYGKAEQSYLEAKTAKEQILGKEHQDYATGLNNLGMLYNVMGQYDKAAQYHLEAKDLREKIVGRAHPDYAGSLINLGIVYRNLSQYEQAKELYLEAKDIFEAQLQMREHPFYLNCLNNLGTLHRDLGQYKEAEPLYLQVKELRKKIFGEEHASYASSLSNLGVLYYYMGQYEQAETHHLEAMKIREKIVGREHLDFTYSLLSLGSLYQSMGRAEQAEQMWLEVMTIWNKVLDKDHPYHARILSNLGNLYVDLGQFERAETFYLESGKKKEKIWGKKSHIYAENQFLLGIVYRDMGRYEESERHFLDAQSILENDLQMQEHPLYAACLNSMGILYKDLSRFDQAEQLHLTSLAIQEKSLGKEHPNYTKGLVNLGVLYEDIGKYESAESIYLKAKASGEEIWGKDNPEYIGILVNLGNVYADLEQYEQAESFYLEAKTIFEEEFKSRDHPFYFNGLEGLAHVYFDQGQYAKAAPIYQEVNALREEVQGREHPLFALNLNHLERVYTAMGQYELASQRLHEVAPIRQSLLLKAARHSTERELSAYTQQFVQELSDLFSFVHQYPKVDSSLQALCYDQALFHKGFLLQATNDLRGQAQSDSATQALFHLWQSYHRRLADQYASPLNERKDIADLEEKANLAEKELTQRIAGFGQALQQVSWQEVQAKMKPGEAAIEFVHYRLRDSKQEDSVMYAGILLRADGSDPTFIPLFGESELELAVQTQSGSIKENLVDRGIKPRQQKTASSAPLNWQPLTSQLEGIHRLYFAPSGFLHRLNLGASFLNEEETFADSYQLIQLNSTRQLVIPHSDNTYANDAVLFGGINYEVDTLGPVLAYADIPRSNSPNPTTDLHIGQADRSLRGEAWTFLPGTEKEVLGIHDMLNSSQYHAKLHTGTSATEEAFLQLGRLQSSPRILHVATHGFFFPDPELSSGSRDGFSEPSFKLSDHPMIRSGLILAGGNHVWQGNPSLPNREDGILTAYEISQMDLSHTELVVLSACETGLGDIQGNEGVYGLQRAFRVAGVRYLIMSLWQVPDQETQEFMRTFYRNWLKKEMSIPVAFRASQQRMRKKYKSPSAWAAFVLVE